MKRLLLLLALCGCGREPLAPQPCVLKEHKKAMTIRNTHGDSVGVVLVLTFRCEP